MLAAWGRRAERGAKNSEFGLQNSEISNFHGWHPTGVKHYNSQSLNAMNSMVLVLRVQKHVKTGHGKIACMGQLHQPQKHDTHASSHQVQVTRDLEQLVVSNPLLGLELLDVLPLGTQRL